MAISNMQQPRQMYGLGSFVKKAFRKIKKIAKSPLGKAAILGGLGYGLGGGFSGAGFSKGQLLSKIGLGRFSPKNLVDEVALTGNTKLTGGSFLNKFLNPFNKNNPLLYKGGEFSGKRAFGLGSAFALGAPLIKNAMAKPEEIIDEVDEDYIPPYMAYQMARNKDPYMSFLPPEASAQSGFYLPQNAANGGRIGYANGEMVQESVEEVRLPDEAEQMLQVEYQKYIEGGGQLPYPEFKKLVLQQMKDEQEQPQVDETMVAENVQPEAPAQGIAQLAMGGTAVPGYGTPAGTNQFGYPSGGVRVGAEEGGLMNLGGMEKDYRAEGGFVPIGKKEKADDVPARLSVNEFVFTADAVRNAGGGDIDKGAEVMENMMGHLENGGQISEESQGGEGAQAMYDQQQMLQSRMG